LAPNEELALVKRAILEWSTAPTGANLRSVFRTLVDKELGYPIAESTISGMLRRSASQLLPSGEVWELERFAMLLSGSIRAEKRIQEIRGR
jgi:hypothetical protein